MALKERVSDTALTIQSLAKTMQVLEGMYTCTRQSDKFMNVRLAVTWIQFFLPFHSIGVVKNEASKVILSKPPNCFSSLLRTMRYFPGSSMPTR